MATPHVIYYRDHQAASTAVLRFLAQNRGAIEAMNVRLRAEEVPRPGTKGAKAMLNYLRRMGADEIPALVTPTGVHLGKARIFDIYEKNLRGLEAARADAQRKKRANPSGDVLHEYMLQGLNADDRDEDEAMDATPDFGGAIHRAMEERKGPGRPGTSRPPTGSSSGSGSGDPFGESMSKSAPTGQNQDDILLAQLLGNNETTM